MGKLVTLLIAVIQYVTRANLKEGLCDLQFREMQSVLAKEPWLQEHEAAGHIASAERGECWCSTHFLVFYSI